MSSVIVATSPRPNGFAFSGTKVPAGPDWIHEVKRDGCRMLVVRENGRVRLLARNGYDRSDRYPWIVEAALKNPQKHFVIDGEAVVLGVDGTSDFDACIHASTMKRCSSMPSGAAHGRHLYCPIRARRDRARPVSPGLLHGPGGPGVEIPRPRLSRWPIAPLDQGQNPNSPAMKRAKEAC